MGQRTYTTNRAEPGGSKPFLDNVPEFSNGDEIKRKGIFFFFFRFKYGPPMIKDPPKQRSTKDLLIIDVGMTIHTNFRHLSGQLQRS